MKGRLLNIEEIAQKTEGKTLAQSLLIVRNLQDGRTAKLLNQQWIEEIEKSSTTEKLPYRDGGYVIRTIPESSWQGIKSKMVEKK